jgi:hypothetical protein
MEVLGVTFEFVEGAVSEGTVESTEGAVTEGTVVAGAPSVITDVLLVPQFVHGALSAAGLV